MKVIIATIAAFGILGGIAGCRTQAADLSGPPATFEDILKLKALKPALAGCYAETSVQGSFLVTGSRDAQAGIGGGCDTVIGNTIIGAGIRADWMDLQSGSLFGKIGLTINPYTSVYALGVWSVPDWKIKQAGQFQVGAGSELSITSLVPNMSLFAEATTAISKFGPAATKDDVAVRFGARYRF